VLSLHVPQLLVVLLQMVFPFLEILMFLEFHVDLAKLHIFTSFNSRFCFHSLQFKILFSQSSVHDFVFILLRVQDLVFTALDSILGALGRRDCVGQNKVSLLLCTVGIYFRGVD